LKGLKFDPVVDFEIENVVAAVVEIVAESVNFVGVVNAVEGIAAFDLAASHLFVKDELKRGWEGSSLMETADGTGESILSQTFEAFDAIGDDWDVGKDLVGGKWVDGVDSS